MNAFTMGTRLRDMIRAIRACKTAAEERAVVRKECAAIRTSISENDPDYRHRNLAKLMFIHMLGYPTHFGQMECLKLIASAGFPEKRIGYLGLMLLLDERQEVLMLVTNSLKQDLNHMNQYIVGLALSALGNICSAEMARDLAPEVEKLLQSSNPNIRKKAALCSVRIIRKVPDLAENFMKPASVLLSEKHHGVLIAGIQLCTELCKASIEALDHIRKYTKDLVRILKNMVTSGYAPEYDVGGITDPFLQIRVLRLLRILGKGDADSSDIMSDILAQVATNTESNKNAGNAILYECVQTIMAIDAIGGLRVLAINILGRFLSNRDNNIRYVALNMLMKAVTVDFQAVQRHRTTILECVKDSDASIKKRALELVFLLVNDTNVKPLTKELLDYLKVSDPEFKSDLTAKICSIVEKFSPSKLWYIDQMIKVLIEAGSYVKDEVCHSLIVVISNAMDLQGYTVRSLYQASQRQNEHESLVRVTIWCIGEYGEMLLNHAGELEGEEPLTVTESDVVDFLEAVLKGSTSNMTTRAMTLTSLLKLSSRFPPCSERIKGLIIQHKGNFALEMQQRSIEFSSILHKHENIKSALVERMPVLDELAYTGKKADNAGGVLATGSGTKVTSSGTPAKLPNGVSKPPTNALMDLLDLSVEDTPPPTLSSGDILQDLLGVGSSPAPAFPGLGNASVGSADVLLDLLSIGTPPAPVQSTSTTSNLASFTQAKPASVIDPLSQLASLTPSVSPSQEQRVTSSFIDNRSIGLAVNGIHEATKPSLPAAPIVDLLGDLSPPPAVSGDAVPTYPSIVAFQSRSLKVAFDFTKQPGKPQFTIVQASFTNLTSMRQRRHSKERKRPGEIIYKGHRNYDLMLNLQLGIRYAVGKVTPVPKREIVPVDFDSKASIWMRFPSEGSACTPPHHSVDFKWKDYCPMVFRHLRELFKIDAADYMLSICGNDALRELSSPGKSGSVFYLSQNDRFMIKTMRKSEVKVLLRMLPNYYNHVRTYESTLITKFYGLHSIKIAGGQKVQFIVMGNMFCSELPIHRRFDLKGSSQGRSTDKVEIDETTTLKDLDLHFVFQLEPLWRQALLKQIECDCNFLEAERIMDYSLLLGLHLRAPQYSTDFSPKDYSTDMCLSNDETFEALAFDEPDFEVENTDLVLPGTARLGIRLGVNMPARAIRRARRVAQDSHPEGGLFAQDYDVVLYFGIIDILQDYDIAKRLEHAYKSLQFDSHSISAVDPKLYSKRFQDFISRIFPGNS